MAFTLFFAFSIYQSTLTEDNVRTLAAVVHVTIPLNLLDMTILLIYKEQVVELVKCETATIDIFDDDLGVDGVDDDDLLHH